MSSSPPPLNVRQNSSDQARRALRRAQLQRAPANAGLRNPDRSRDHPCQVYTRPHNRPLRPEEVPDPSVAWASAGGKFVLDALENLRDTVSGLDSEMANIKNEAQLLRDGLNQLRRPHATTRFPSDSEAWEIFEDFKDKCDSQGAGQSGTASRQVSATGRGEQSSGAPDLFSPEAKWGDGKVEKLEARVQELERENDKLLGYLEKLMPLMSRMLGNVGVPTPTSASGSDPETEEPEAEADSNGKGRAGRSGK